MLAGPHKWRDLMEPVMRAREELGLNATDLSVLRAILSFIPGDTLGTDRPENHICFAGNLTIADRVGTSGDSTVNRCLRRLETAGLVLRRQSPNRKRYAFRDRQGDVLHAYGIDVTPLIARGDELATMASEVDRERHELHVLRDRCKVLLHRLMGEAASSQPHAIPDATLIDHARRVLRRKPRHAELLELFEQLKQASTAADQQTAVYPQNTTGEATDIQTTRTLSNRVAKDERHIESLKEHPDNPPIALRDLRQAFPTLFACLTSTRSENELHRNADILVTTIPNATAPWQDAIRHLGFGPALILLGFIIENYASIQNHGGYLARLIEQHQRGLLDLRALVKMGQHRTENAQRPETHGAPDAHRIRTPQFSPETHGTADPPNLCERPSAQNPDSATTRPERFRAVDRQQS
ncbi:plasmid replication protein RepC [Amaricoccus sp. W119]|uniref:plasmid replication protein RepC n=1 Tax=Amaricoccus sp. W119 TaxID=3391833 RepID=UPI0039A743C3